MRVVIFQLDTDLADLVGLILGGVGPDFVAKFTGQLGEDLEDSNGLLGPVLVSSEHFVGNFSQTVVSDERLDGLCVSELRPGDAEMIVSPFLSAVEVNLSQNGCVQDVSRSNLGEGSGRNNLALGAEDDTIIRSSKKFLHLSHRRICLCFFVHLSQSSSRFCPQCTVDSILLVVVMKVRTLNSSSATTHGLEKIAAVDVARRFDRLWRGWRGRAYRGASVLDVAAIFFGH